MEEVLREGKNFSKVDVDRADEGVGKGGEETLPDGIAEEGLHEGCFESGEGFFAEDCGHGMSERERM